MKFTTSLFSQILHIVPRHSFLRLVHKCGVERHAKGIKLNNTDSYESIVHWDTGLQLLRLSLVRL